MVFARARLRRDDKLSGQGQTLDPAFIWRKKMKALLKASTILIYVVITLLITPPLITIGAVTTIAVYTANKHKAAYTTQQTPLPRSRPTKFDHQSPV
jgi:hypothetical protein